ncbi:MAG TPA: heterodisulfide reductase-related iron-sulfur binding cluster, partial [Candidatus Binatus sp.]|nr:heterodisulfide reductase-related iron-sulfur binding cluster [Candidatus Binatus sp.]
HRANGLPLRNKLFGAIESINRIGSALAPVSNWLANSVPNRRLMEIFTGIDRRRPLPQFASESFEAWFAKHKVEGDGSKGEVVLFNDTFNNYNTPHVAIAAARFLEKASYRVALVEKKCCGRPMISKGMLSQAKENAAWNVEKFAPFAVKGTPIIGLEPSCLLTLRDEYPEFIRSDAAKKVAATSFLFEEFVMREVSAGRLQFNSNAKGKKVLLHGHCHQKALVGTAPTITMLKAAGYEVSEVDSGCCGMAGSFGFEKEHYELSTKIGNRRLAPAVKAVSADVEVVAPGISCRQQIDHLAQRQAKHPAELLWESVR